MICIIGVLFCLQVQNSSAQGNALDFDGTDDYILTSLNSSASNIITIEGWFSFNTLGSQQNLIHINQGGGSDCRIVPYKDATDQINLFVSDGIDADVLFSGYEVNANTWYHIAFVYNNQFASIYINGELKASETLDYAYSLDGTDLLYIASDVGSNYFTDAKIDEVRIWNTARTATEIKENLSNPLVGNETGLVVYYNFNMLSGTSLPDQSTNSNDGTLYNMNDDDWVESYAMVYPISADITTYDSESFTFSWDAPETGIVEAYLIDIDDNIDFSSPLSGYDGYNSGTDTFETITGLDPVTTYYARVRGFKSSVGEVGAWSEVKSVTTAKADQIITFGEIPVKAYGDANFEPGATASSGLTVSYSSSDEDVATIVSGKIHIVSAGTCTIYANQAGNATYNAAAAVEQSLTINPKELTVTGASASNKTYDGTTDAVITGTLSGIIGSETVTLNGTGIFDDANVGTAKAVTSTSTLGGADAGNYTLTQPTGLTADITAVALEITADAQTKEEGQTDPALTYSITGGSLIAGESLTGELSRETGETAGTYTILQGTLTAGTNYSITFVSADFVITLATSINTQSMVSLNVYPNPASEMVYIELENINAQMLTITDITGNQVYIQTNIEPVIAIDLSGMSNGVYILSIKTNKQIITTRIIKK